MRYWQHFADDPVSGTLLRADGDRVEILSQRTTQWKPAPLLLEAWNMTADWDEITVSQAVELEAIQRERRVANA